jgi:ferredoxin-nitrite reductase
MGSGGFVPARDIDVFVPPEDAEELCTQLVFVFRDNGPREARARARLAFLIDDWGVERFRAELQLRLARPLERAGRDQRHAYETEHIGVTPLRETGRYAIGLAVPVGRLTADQLCGVADLAQEYGDGTARLTPGQNLVLVGVEGSRLAKLFGEPLLRVLRHDPPPSIRATVACTGIGLCDLALTDTKVDALAVARRLEPVIPLAGQRPMSINWSGCPAACASHHGADIGLQGAKVRVGERVIEVYDVSVGGRVGRLPRPARPLLRHVPVEQIAAIVERLALAHTDGADLYEAGPRIVSELEPTLAARVPQTGRGD